MKRQARTRIAGTFALAILGALEACGQQSESLWRTIVSAHSTHAERMKAAERGAALPPSQWYPRLWEARIELASKGGAAGWGVMTDARLCCDARGPRYLDWMRTLPEDRRHVLIFGSSWEYPREPIRVKDIDDTIIDKLPWPLSAELGIEHLEAVLIANAPTEDLAAAITAPEFESDARAMEFVRTAQRMGRSRAHPSVPILARLRDLLLDRRYPNAAEAGGDLREMVQFWPNGEGLALARAIAVDVLAKRPRCSAGSWIDQLNVRYNSAGDTVESQSATLILAAAAVAFDTQAGDIHTRSSCYAAPVSRMMRAKSPNEWERRLMRLGTDQTRALADFEEWFRQNEARLGREAESERPAYEAAGQKLDSAGRLRH